MALTKEGLERSQMLRKTLSLSKIYRNESARNCSAAFLR